MSDIEMVRVDWVDSCGMRGWNSRDELNNLSLSTCVTVGILVGDNDDMMQIAQSVDVTNDNVNDVIAIPKVVISSVKRI